MARRESRRNQSRGEGATTRATQSAHDAGSAKYVAATEDISVGVSDAEIGSYLSEGFRRQKRTRTQRPTLVTAVGSFAYFGGTRVALSAKALKHAN